jgi:hypothetical protein
MNKIRIEHGKWGRGTKLYELSGGFEFVVHFDSFGQIRVLSKECKEVKEEPQKDLENINSLIQSITSFIKKHNGEVTKKEIIQTLNIDENLFNSLVPKVVRIDGFKIINSIDDPKSYSIKYIPPSPAYEIHCKKMLEAFRLGVAPGFAITDITVGRERELEIIHNWQKYDFGSLMLIGQYGQGKSHMIRYIREKALQEGYVVATCDIGKESQMSKPRTVLSTLLKTMVFRINEENSDSSDTVPDPLLTLLIIYASECVKNNENIIEDNLYFGQISKDLIYRIKNKIPLEDEYVRQFIEYMQGDDSVRRFRRIPNYATDANIVCNVLSAIGNMAHYIQKSTGLKGLLLIFDEGEDINNTNHQKQQRLNGKNFLFGLTKTANNDKDLYEESVPDDLSKNSDNKWEGDLSGLIYSGIVTTKYSDFSHSHLKTLYAFVEGEDEIIDELELLYTEKIELSEFSENEKQKLVEKISKIHQTCYDYKLENYKRLESIILKKLTGGGNTRSAIKTTAEALDLIHSNPGIDYDVILRERNTY